jgi:hypothetical protein
MKYPAESWISDLKEFSAECWMNGVVEDLRGGDPKVVGVARGESWNKVLQVAEAQGGL